MTLRLLLAALGLLACAAARAATLPPTVTQDLARRLDDLSRGALERRDTALYLRETFPGAVTMLGGPENARAAMSAFFDQMAAQHVAILSHASHPEADTTDAGPYEVLRIPEESLMQVGERRIAVSSYSLAVRRKPDGAWSFIAGSGIQKHPDVLQKLLPDLPRDFRLPPCAMRPL